MIRALALQLLSRFARPAAPGTALRWLFYFAVPWLLVGAAWAAPVGTAFTYQGSVDKSGVPGSGTCTFQFKLFDAALGGAQVGPTLTPSVTLLENGQFSVTLDFGGVFDGNARWLEVAVQCPGDASLTVLGPRQALTPAPYALWALATPGGGGGFVLPYFGPVTSAAQDAFKIQNNATSGAFYAIHGASATTATNAGGVLGEATAASGQVIGVFGKSVTSPNGIGVIGQGNVNGAFFEALNTTGDGTAVWGLAHTSANNAAGVKGSNTSTTGSTVGVWGLATSSPMGTGVAGQGSAVGGYFTSSTASVGDFAGAYGIGNANPGVKGVSTSNDGVYGQGGNAGVNGKGTNYGVTGTSYGGFGVYGTYGAGVIPASGTNSGVYGYTFSSNPASAGVRGEGDSGTGVHGISNTGDGVLGQTGGNGRTGVWGISYHAGGYGGVFQNNAGGVALYANGLAQVKTLQILGADLAESFPVKEARLEPGTVVMIDGGADGALRTCDEAYSHRVAGVVSGANGLDAGVVLKGRAFDEAGHAAVAMSGRVWVKCDASAAPIRPGDLLTTAARAGHAMRASDRDRAYGAILGKAMTSLETGTGLVLVLVNLQ